MTLSLMNNKCKEFTNHLTILIPRLGFKFASPFKKGTKDAEDGKPQFIKYSLKILK